MRSLVYEYADGDSEQTINSELSVDTEDMQHYNMTSSQVSLLEGEKFEKEKVIIFNIIAK